jgi:hypothetical protein
MCNDCLDHYRHGSRAPDNYWSAATLLAFRRTYASRQGGARATSSKHINRPQNFPISVVFKIACTEVCLPYAALLAKHPPETSGHLTWQVRRRRKHSAGPRVEENIMKFHPAFFSNFGWLCRGGCALALAVSLPLGSGLAMAQEQVQSQQSQQQTHEQQAQQGQQESQQQQGQQPPPVSQQQPTQEEQAPPPPPQPPPPSQDTNRSPVSQDQVPPNPNPPQQADRPPVPPPQDGNRPPISRDQVPGSQNGPNDQYAPPPPELTIPAGTIVIMRINEPLSSDHNQVGDQFTGVLEQPIVVNGWVVARRGETVMGQVKSVKKAGRVAGTSQLGIELTDLILVDGEQAPVLTELWKASGGTSHGADAATIAGGTGLGAAIGAAADWGRGAAIGAGAGAVLGIGAVLLTRGRPTILQPESQLSFKLVDPVKVDTTHSQQAFLPVSQDDFGGGRGDRPRLRVAGNGYYGYEGYPAPAPCGYYYPCYYAPGYVGIYPAFGWWGPGFYGRGWYGPRGYRRY